MSGSFFAGMAAIAVLCMPVVAFGASTTVSSAAQAQPQSLSVHVTVEGMTCSSCEAGIELRVRALEGVEAVKASYARSEALVFYIPDRVTLAQILEAIADSGYSAGLVEEDSDSDHLDDALAWTSGCQ